MSGDATHTSLPCGASQGAQIVFLCGNNRAVPIAWKLKKLERVSKSPMASETMFPWRMSRCKPFCCFDDKRDLGIKNSPKSVL